VEVSSIGDGGIPIHECEIHDAARTYLVCFEFNNEGDEVVADGQELGCMRLVYDRVSGRLTVR
jgi:hypothetical protein